MTAVTTVKTVLNVMLPALTPVQRWDAAGKRFSTHFIAENWFIITAVVTLIILILMFCVVSYRRRTLLRRGSEGLFLDYAEKCGLSEHERQILLDIADKAKLKECEAIFTMASAFDQGAAIMIKEILANPQTADEGEQLRAELSFLREKLGFQKQPSNAIGSTTRTRKLSSRQIPVGKKLHITRRHTRDLTSIESTVVKNDDVELTVQLTMPLESTPGEFWRARYYFGASVWEFDTYALRSNGDILVLNHNDNVRFINRRRFLRVPVHLPALVAHFPFAKEPTKNNSTEKEQDAAGNEQRTNSSSWGPPEFVPATVTELAGPGLRIEAPLTVNQGDRVLVVLRLPCEPTPNGGEEDQNSDRKQVSNKTKIVEDIGEVRHTKAIPNGFSIAVELTGLRDSDVNELIRATNAASLKAGSAGQDTTTSADEKQDKEVSAVELATT